MLAMTDPTDTYEQGRQGDSYNPAGNGSLEDQYNYQDGQAERAEQERRAVDDARSTAEQQQRWRDERDATDRQSQPVATEKLLDRKRSPGFSTRA